MSLRRLFAITTIVALTILAWSKTRDFVTGIDWDVDRYIEELDAGVSKQSVIEVLGEPSRTENDCCLPNGPTKENKIQLSNVDAHEFLLWRNGANQFYCLGFDEHGSLVTVLTGSS